jgi:ribosome-binding factor A
MVAAFQKAHKPSKPAKAVTFARMESNRQKRVANLLQQDMAELFRILSKEEFRGVMISVSKLRISPDLGYAKVYLSMFPVNDKEQLLLAIREMAPKIRFELGKRIGKQLRIVPELEYFIDDSIDYEAQIDKLLREGGENPIK